MARCYCWRMTSNVLCLLRSTSRRGLAKKVRAYLAEYHPAGYGTRVVSRWKFRNLYCAALERSSSCD